MGKKELNVIVTVGIPGSGKSTWAKEFIRRNDSYVRVNRDDIRRMLLDTTQKSDARYSTDVDDMVRWLRDQAISEALRIGKDIIIDECAVFPHSREHIRQLLAGFMAYDSRGGGVTQIKLTWKRSFWRLGPNACLLNDYLRNEDQVGTEIICKMRKEALEADKRWAKKTDRGRFLTKTGDWSEILTRDNVLKLIRQSNEDLDAYWGIA